ncbi:hypothetical protein BOTBODRAFT_30507 [Botryobasidium botryosum FD-172 SS1]|uniref:Uncharacterized protein n=1 Tax=Botryobasidium botryosum (strain FD-172 SS1) TaxID=930990 RepID=A0A067N022_BOTB1|nr:hypothetical protein BOTBODRAFT_30507 [Botryobasidium botryosum FD-172 SS1]
MFIRRLAAAPRSLAARAYSTGAPAGSIPRAKGFKEKEQAQENVHAHQKDEIALKKLREQLLAKQKEAAELEESLKKAEEAKKK